METQTTQAHFFKAKMVGQEHFPHTRTQARTPYIFTLITPSGGLLLEYFDILQGEATNVQIIGFSDLC